MNRPRLCKTVRFTTIRDNIYITHPKMRYINKNEYDVLRMCDGTKSVSEIGYSLSQDYKGYVNLQDVNSTIEKFSWLFI